MSKTRDNHYVPQWHQEGFFTKGENTLCYLDLNPDQKRLDDGRLITMNNQFNWPTSKCFYKTDLYSTFFGAHINDEIERRLFGQVDDSGAKAVRAFSSDNASLWNKHFMDFFEYLDTQRIRTPKGLDWVRAQYSALSQNDLMKEMQGIRNMNCSLWTEGTREIVSAEESATKFIVTDHPVTIFNYACPPEHKLCQYPNDPSIALKGSQTLFPMNKDHCLIISNLEYAEAPDDTDPIERRSFPKNFRNSMVKTDAFIRERKLNEEEVIQINFILKSRARRYIGAGKKEWLYPDRKISHTWKDLRRVLTPPHDHLWHFGGEMFARFEDGSVHWQDKFGRTEKPFEHLQKKQSSKSPKPNQYCGCGSGKKYRKCCKGLSVELRPTWSELSIRERNILLFTGVTNVLKLDKLHDWAEVRRNLTSEQISTIYKIYSSLWPLETDLQNLLPKPDGRARALYTGIVDPRLIDEFLVGSTLYFGDIIVQNPMLHPRAMNPKYSPIENPEQYRQEIIKNVVLLMKLMPFIDAGTINFIPDPCIFDSHLREQMFTLSKHRNEGQKHNMDDDPRSKWAQMDDVRRSIRAMPESFQRKSIREAITDIDDEGAEKALKYIRQSNENDPLATLKEIVSGESEADGQLLMLNMSPNFEISLYIAQLTGSFIITDSIFRWRELQKAQQRDQGLIVQKSTDLTRLIEQTEHYFASGLQEIAKLSSKGVFREYRRFVRDLYTATNGGNSLASISKLNDKFVRAAQQATAQINRSGMPSFAGKINCLIPSKGILHNNTQRMLLTSGSELHTNGIPIAFYMSRTDIQVYMDDA